MPLAKKTQPKNDKNNETKHLPTFTSFQSVLCILQLIPRCWSILSYSVRYTWSTYYIQFHIFVNISLLFTFLLANSTRYTIISLNSFTVFTAHCCGFSQIKNVKISQLSSLYLVFVMTSTFDKNISTGSRSILIDAFVRKFL